MKTQMCTFALLLERKSTNM